MLSLLRDPAWQGVAGIIAIISLVLYVFIERNKLFGKISINKQRIISGFLTVIFVSSGGFLGIGAILTIDAFVTRYGLFWGSMLAAIILNLGLFVWFALWCSILFNNTIKDYSTFLSWLLSSFIMYGVALGFVANLSHDLESAIDIIFAFGVGGFTIGSTTIGYLSLTSKKYNKDDAKEKENINSIIK